MRSFFTKITKRINNAFIEIADNKGNSDVIYYGDKNTFPNELLQVVNSSPTASAALAQKSKFIYADGFADAVFALQTNANGETYDEVLRQAADSYAYFDGCYYRVLYSLDNKPASIEVLPYETVRRCKDGRFVVNKNFGRSSYKRIEDEYYLPFDPTRSLTERIAIIEADGGLDNQKGEILYSFRKRPGANIYAIPQYYAGLEDIKSDTGVMMMEYANITQGFNVDLILFTVGKIDDSIKDEDGKTEYDRFKENLKEFRQPGERKILHIEAETKDAMPVVTPVPLKDILDGIDNARDRIPRAVCRHIGVPPVLVGLQQPEGLGNTQAIVNSMKLFMHSLRWYQNRIADDFRLVFSEANTMIKDVVIIDV